MMAEDAHGPETADNENDDSKPDASKEEEKKAAATEEPETKRWTLSGKALVGRVLNVRMLRRVVQIVFLLGINATILAAWFGNDAIVAFWQGFRNALPTLPIIAPLNAPFAVIAGSFDSMQREFTMGVFPFFTLGAMMIILIVVGRGACAWVCPIGTIQDFATLPNRNKTRPAPNTEIEFRRIKAYVFVVVMFLAVWVAVSHLTGQYTAIRAALGIFANAAFDPFNPAYIIFVIAPGLDWPTGLNNLWLLTTFGVIVWLQLIFVVVVIVVSFWIPRWFCRWLCPAGWFYGVFSRNALIGIGRNPARCTPDVCNVCEVACPMNIRIRRYPYQHMHSPDCIMCLECKSHCPNKAIVVRFS